MVFMGLCSAPMDPLTLTGIALGLSMDAFAVSVANGFMIKELHIRYAFRIAFFFGLFQAVMPLLGWGAGLGFSRFIAGYDHWIAFGLLSFMGGKMIWESRVVPVEGCEEERHDCTHFPTLLIMSVATSLDALAAGLSFAILHVKIVVPVVVIGGVTFLLCFVGIYLGDRIGRFFEKKLELAGGLVLIGIGFKILAEHLLA